MTREDELIELADHALEAMVESSVAGERAHLILADRYCSRGDFPKALDVLDRFLASVPEGKALATVAFKARIFEIVGQNSDAIRWFNEVLAIVGDDLASPENLCAAGLSHHRLHSLLPSTTAEPHAELALRHLEELIRCHPNYDDDLETVMLAIGDLREEKGDFAAAIDAYRRAVELCADSEQRHWTQSHLAGALRLAGDFEAAERIFATALLTAPEPVRSVLHLDLGTLLLERGRVEEAHAAFVSALNIENAANIPEYSRYLPDVLWNLAALAYQGSDSETALTYLERALPLISSDHLYFADINIVLGHCHAERGNQVLARRHYNAALFAPLATSEQVDMAARCLKEMGEVAS